ncbi:T9SS type A sorting domain-containing protein [Spirosoma sp. RP8]|uniref:T9SS type A sorting domain-containing protein n=1 Tax=Spirosoma liriopis TaxID=2937440 RepID=A0ABT0HRY8_9BACT|nr:T9SS type A sorting domain-containing protein [Spirosoma liriopis]MCK8494602.1 T9SS type A sorting domain-containing protein [Spirosoma liriopis]
MNNLFLSTCLISLALTAFSVSAQNAINNASLLPATSDNSGSTRQTGTEVLHSSPGEGVQFETRGTFEHLGQFYVAQDGLWNQPAAEGKATNSTDYFGYAPPGIGSGLAYQGRGILGASASHGGSGAGRPNFEAIQLNSTGIFPLAGGMYVATLLAFNGNGPGLSSVITTPNCSSPQSALNAVIFAPTASVSGANEANYIDGYASVEGVTIPFTLPLGDAAGDKSAYHPLTINSAPAGAITARYVHQTPYQQAARVQGIDWISPIGSWRISAPSATSVTVYTPALEQPVIAGANLHLLGWTGSQWIDLSETSATASAWGSGWAVTGSLVEGITDLAVGLVGQTELVEAPELRLWPNPTKGVLNVELTSQEPLSAIQVLDLKGRRLFGPSVPSSVVNTSPLPVGNYVLEVQTSQGRSLRRRFVKQ